MGDAESSVLGISFDGLAISGIVGEFVNLASVFHERGFQILFDPGFDIKMGLTNDTGWSGLPAWIRVINSLGAAFPPGYSKQVVKRAAALVSQGTPVSESSTYSDLCKQLAAAVTQTLDRENVRILVVENGTLPDNPLFTEAVYQAIENHGIRYHLGNYVLWRDHDMMWSAQPQLYGAYPYPGVRRPKASPYITYAVATQWMRARVTAWAPEANYKVLPNRFHLRTLPPTRSKRSIRAAYSVPADALLIARCSRVVPAKCIERDLRLVDRLQKRLAALDSPRKVYLFVTGPIQEDPNEYARLRQLTTDLGIETQVVWADGLLPFINLNTEEETGHFSIRELLAEADLSSFLTSYDYEGFGNPPGEAMAAGVPFVATTYELYHEVYGSKGTVAPLLHIDRDSAPADSMPDDFIDWTFQVLTDQTYRAQIVAKNLEVCRRHFSLDALAHTIDEYFGQVHLASH
jgi:glycosyltransferase involved in cell wall biosynthesis